MVNLKYVIPFLLFLQLTDLYKVILMPLGLMTNVFSTLTLFICISYIFLKRKLLFTLKRKFVVNLWINLIWIFPVFFTLIHMILGNLNGDQFIYYLSFISLFGAMFVVSLLFAYEVDAKIIKKILVWSAIAGSLGILISYINYPLIVKIISTSEKMTGRFDFGFKEIERAPGFYGQSNTLARALVLFFVALTPFYYIRNSVKNKIIIFALFFLVNIYFTGSRTSLLVFFSLIVLFIPFFFNKQILAIRIFKIFKYCFIGIMLFYFLLIFSSTLSSWGVPDLSSRLDFGSENLEQDASVGYRIETANLYIDHISNNIFIGKGPVYRYDMIEKGIFKVGAQNEYLESGLAFGIFSILILIAALMYTLYLTEKTAIGSSIKIFCVAIAIYGFSVNYLFLNRVTVIVFGILLGMYLKELSIRKTSVLNI